MKLRIVSVLLFLFAAWPLVQYDLTRRYGVDPWKLFGFSMYCVPGPMKTVRIFQISSDGSFHPLDFQAYTPEEQRVVDTFRERRRALGLLESSETLAAELLALRPEFEGVVVVVLSLELDRESARLRPDVQFDTWWRDGRDEPFDFGFAAPPS